MSASLVGSEMCIRDRKRRQTGRRTDRHTGRQADKQAGRQAHRPAGGPVSYTHLTLPTICSV
eukprot:6304436-Alexandrium_andersonii.AAC.1